jgi:hypothetical protein
VNPKGFARSTGGVLGGVGRVVDVVVSRHLGSLGCNSDCSWARTGPILVLIELFNEREHNI